MKNRIRINGLIIAAGVIVVALWHNYFLRLSAGGVDGALRMGGILLFLWGILLRISSRGFKSEHSESGGALVTLGPYAAVRNPMYIGILCIGVGIVLMVFQLWVLAIFLVFMAGRYFTLILKEERLLEERFQEEFIEYRKRTPRLFPKLSALSKADACEVLPMRLAWVTKEVNSALLILAAVEAAQLWELKRSGYAAALRSSMIGQLVIFGFFCCVIALLASKYEKNTRKSKDT